MSFDQVRMERLLSVMENLGGRAHYRQLKQAGVINPMYVEGTVRAIVAGKLVTEDQPLHYVVNPTNVAEWRKLAGMPPAETDPQERRAQTAVKSASGPAEPEPPQKGRPTREGTKAPSEHIPCLRCQMKFPPSEFDAGPGRRRFRNCSVCRGKPTNSGRGPITITDVIERHTHDTGADLFLDLRHLPKLRRYLEQLLATGLYGRTLEQCAQRLLSDGVLRAIESGLINRQEIDR